MRATRKEKKGVSRTEDAPVGERGDDQTAGVAEVLVPIQKLCVHGADVQVLPGPVISEGRRECVNGRMMEKKVQKERDKT